MRIDRPQVEILASQSARCSLDKRIHILACMDLRQRFEGARKTSKRMGGIFRRSWGRVGSTLSTHFRLPDLKLRSRIRRGPGRLTLPEPSPPDPAILLEGTQRRMAAIEATLGWRFNDRSLLRDALTHRSYLNETRDDRPSNERLEFLGDSVLGLIVTDYLYHRFPDLTEGELTNLRSALVRTEALARFAREMNLGTSLFVGKGEEQSRGRQRPAGLACAFEALLGAIYLDRGYEVARVFALSFAVPALDDVFELQLHRNGKSMLQELVQANRQQTPSYHVVREIGPDHDKSFTVEVRIGSEVLGKGVASNKRTAEQLAAQDALEDLQHEPSTSRPKESPSELRQL